MIPVVNLCVSEESVQIHSFACGYPFVLAPCAKRTILLRLNGLGTLVENQLTMVFICDHNFLYVVC